MFDSNDLNKNGKVKNKTKLHYNQIVDLMIINNFDKIHISLEKFLDKDTMLIKNLGQDIYYIEDQKKKYLIITINEKNIVIKINGLKTEIMNLPNNT